MSCLSATRILASAAARRTLTTVFIAVGSVAVLALGG